MQEYYSKFKNLSEIKQRRIIAFTAILLNWALLSWFPINAFLIYILARGLTTNNSNTRVLGTISTMYSELKYISHLILTQYSKLKETCNNKNPKHISVENIKDDS
jgi:hypothetical protein